ncbi:MAG: PrsW family glutamic-type intramembrane protease [Methylacidiphilales bacterium]|nr:PrsW family glutamic-type intramembrane protease [Candidatus Methylacidiphilales bacterium]
MQIYLTQDGSHTGPFTLEEVQRMLGSGQRSPDDYAWHQGLANWVPLSSILSSQTALVPPPMPPPYAAQGVDWRQRAGAAFEKVAGDISTVAGGERIEGLDGREFFSNVFKKRTDEEMENLFVTGTRFATPLLKDIKTQWPKPWVFFKAIVVSLLVFGGFYYGSVQMNDSTMIPGAILVGSFAIPLSALIFFIEMNVARNISVYQILKLVMMGGVIALLIAILLEDWIIPKFSTAMQAWGTALTAGVAEESGKALVAIFFMGKRRYNWLLNGLLIGAAIGTGFGAFESAGYALNTMLVNYKQMIADQNSAEWTQVVAATMHEIELRGMLAPLGHIAWTALAVAALWKVKGREKFRWEMVKDLRFLRVLGLVAVLHFLWDSPLIVPFVGDALGDVLKCLILGVIAWIAVFGYIQKGLKEIRLAQSEAELGAPGAASAAPPPLGVA